MKIIDIISEKSDAGQERGTGNECFQSVFILFIPWIFLTLRDFFLFKSTPEKEITKEKQVIENPINEKRELLRIESAGHSEGFVCCDGDAPVWESVPMD